MNFKKIFKYTIVAMTCSFLLSLVSVVIYRFMPVYYTPLMFIRIIEKDYSINHQWVDLDQIAKNMQKAVVRSEDAKFYSHNGFDFEAIKKAQEYNKKHKKKKGASTISQQTAKNVFLFPARNYIRKGLEAYFTVLIEFMWTKNRIMEVYLNSIEFGPGVYGVEAAAKKYFKKKASQLTMSEAALMTAVLPNPIKFKIDHPSAYILKRQSKIIGRINRPESTIQTTTEDEDDLFNIISEEEEATTPSSASSVEPETIVQ